LAAFVDLPTLRETIGGWGEVSDGVQNGSADKIGL